MKLLYLANGLPHYFNLVLSKLNAAPGMEVVVVAPHGPGRNIGEGVFQSKQGIAFRVLEKDEYSLVLFSGFRGLAGVILRERPDVIMFPDYMATGLFLHPGVALARRVAGARLVQKSIPFRLPTYAEARRRLRGSLPEPRSRLGRLAAALGLRRALLRLALELRAYCYRNVDAHVNYVDKAREIYGSYGVPRERIWVTRNSPDTDEMARAAAAIGKPPERRARRLLHVGRLVRDKRVDLLLDAMPMVLEKFPDAELIVVGDGPLRAEFEAQASRLGVDRAVRFLGAIYEPEELGRQYLSASIFVLPGLGGLSINEAMFYGLAVICSEGDGTEAFLVREGENGSYFRADDARSLGSALLKTMADPQRLQRMGVRSRDIVAQEVNIGTVIAEYRKALDYACA